MDTHNYCPGHYCDIRFGCDRNQYMGQHKDNPIYRLLERRDSACSREQGEQREGNQD